MFYKKRGQVSDTLTWLVATLVIVVVLFFGVLAAGGSDTVKKALGFDRDVKVNSQSDLLVMKSLTGYLQTKEGEETIYEELSEMDKETLITNDFFPQSDLAEKIFKDLYKGYYDSNTIWVGFIYNTIHELSDVPNDYFGNRGSYNAEDFLRVANEEIIINSQGKIGFTGAKIK